MKNILLVLIILSGNCLNAQVWTDSIRKAQTLHKEQKYSQALDLYKRAKDNSANDKYLESELAQSAYRLGDYESSCSSLELAIINETSPNELSRLYYNLGNVFFKKGNYKEAIDNYKLSLRKNPENQDAKYNLSQVLRKKKNQEKESKNQEKKLPQNEDIESDSDPIKKRKEFSLEKQAADRKLDELLKNAQQTKRRLSNKSAQRKNKNEKDW